MFGKLKEKLSGWAKNLVKNKEEKEETLEKEEIQEVEESQDSAVDTKEAKKVLEEEFKKSKTKKPKEKIKTKKEAEKLEKKEILEPQKTPATQDSAVDTKEAKKVLEEEFEVQNKKKDTNLIQENTLEKEIEIAQVQEKKKSFFKKLTETFTKPSYTKISEEDFSVYSDELEMLLLENNVAYEVVEKILNDLKEKITNKEIPKKSLEEEIKKSLEEIIEEILIEPFDLLEKIKEKKSRNPSEPYVILMCGINGSGKTTTTAKLADYFQRQKLTCVAAAGDTFRAASIEQIKKHGEKLNFKVIAHDYGADPASVGFDAIKYAKKNNINVVLIDTAGRMHTAKNLLKEIEKVERICKPDTKIFVGESITGNDSVEQVKAFDEAVKLDGIILTKADIDEKGGTALSVGYVTGKPILFLGMGQEYKDLEPFNKKQFIEKLGL